MDVAVLSDVYSLRSLVGEIGRFFVKESCQSVDFVILTEQPTAKPAAIAGLPTFSLYDNKEFSISAKSAVLEPVVFLLDYCSESPMSATISALGDALKFAQNKRKVFYLSKFVRTAGRGVEALYKEAREAGVTFVKYEELQVSADLEDEVFSFAVSDGELDLDIKTKTVYTEGGLDVGERFSYIVKKLNLTPNIHGHLTEDTFHLTPALTSRRGVYHLTRDLVAERLGEGLDYIYTLAVSGIWDTPSHGTAVIDGKKCVLCYNCYRACPHAALSPNALSRHSSELTGDCGDFWALTEPKGSETAMTENCMPGYNPNITSNQMHCLSAACYGCGICVGICPAGATSLEYDVALQAEETLGKTLVLSCENSGGASVASLDNIKGLEVLTVPCGGLIETGQLTDYLSTYDKIMVVVCPDDACRHFDGNKRACAQVERLTKRMETIGLSADRLRIVQVSQAMPKILEEEITKL